MLKDREGDMVTRVCDDCGDESRVSYWNVYRKAEHRCYSCANSLNRRGKASWNKGIKREPNKLGNWYINSSGYVEVWIGKHTLPDTASGYYREHRLMAELQLGRPLSKAEKVHHIDGDKTNNLPSNLYVCSTDAEHQSIHQQLEQLAMSLVSSGAIVFSNGKYSVAPQLGDWLSASGELLGTPTRDNQQRSLVSMSPEERSTTIQRWSRIKRSEAPDTSSR